MTNQRKWLDKLSPRMFKIILNLWPPFLGAGIKVKNVSVDYHHIDVEMKFRWYNKNYLNTQFGGSIFAMTDPFYVLMLLKNLGQAYIVWDLAANIQFIKPGRTTLYATFSLTAKDITEIQEKTNTQDKYIFNRQINVTDATGEHIAEINKTIYIRRKNKDR